jgi:carotenoid cleavage dioxygenase
MPLNRRHFLHAAAVSPLWAWALPAEQPEVARRDPQGWPSDNPFLQENFAPVHEEVTVEHLKVVGRLPRELDGIFVRNGPNPQFPPRNRYHWFDGDGMLHGVRLFDGKASYRNRYVRTKKFLSEKKAGKSLASSLLDPPTGGPPSNAANTALVWHAGKFLALWEAGLPHEIRLPDLETVGEYDFRGQWKSAFTAHPKVDAHSGEMVFFGYGVAKPEVQFGIVTADGKLRRSETVALPRAVMMHDFAMTERYAVFLDLPATFDIGRALRGEPIISFEPKHGARLGLLPRQAGAIRWFDIPPCYVFHTLNAYDDGEDVVLLACRYARLPEIFPAQGKYELSQMIPAHLYRWRVRVSEGRVTEEQVDDAVVDFPRVADRVVGRPSRYGYAAEVHGLHFIGLVKYDLQTGACVRHSFGKGRLGGEGVFVQRPDARAEDDGWLLTYVFDQAARRSELIVVDAQAFNKPPVARILLPQRVPYGFHGLWIPSRHWVG